MYSKSIWPAALVAAIIATALLLAPADLSAQVEVVETAVSEGVPGFWSDLEIDGERFAHIAFQDSATDRVRYAWRTDSGWEVETIDTLHPGGWYPSLALEASGVPHVSYFGYTAGDDSVALFHAVKVDSTWNVEVVDIDSTILYFSSWNSIAIGDDGVPRIAYVENAPGRRLKYATRSGGVWSSEIADSTERSGFEAAMALDSNNEPGITHLRFFGDSLSVRYTFMEAGIWSTERIAVTVEDIGWAAVDVEPDGSPVVVYLLSNAHLVHYAERQEGGQWTSVFLDSGAVGADSRPVSVALDHQGRSNVLYYKGSSRDLRYARFYGNTPFRLDVDTGSNVGDFNSLRMDGDGNAHMSYFDRGETSLKYARAKVQLDGISVAPVDTTVDVGDSFAMRATGDFGGGSPVDITADVIWESRAGSIAAVDSAGLVMAIDEGTARIVASLDRFMDSTSVTVNDTLGPYYIIYALPAKKWNLVSFPLESVLPSETIMGTLIDSLGAPDPKVWKLGRWDAAASRYDSLDSPSDRTTPGEGYWLITAADTVFATPIGYYPKDDFSVSLVSGSGDMPAWNQIGFPHNGEIDVDDIWVTDRTDTFSITSVRNNLTETRTLGWINDNWAELGAIGRGSGFWIRKLAAGTVDIIFPIDAVTPTKTGSGVADDDPAEEILWSASLVAAQGGRQSESVVVGVADISSAGWNRFDFALPPKPPGDFLSLAIPRDDLGRLSGDYLSSFLPEGETLSWDLLLRGAKAPGEVSISLDGHAIPAGCSFELTDIATGETTPLSIGRTVTVAATGADGTLRFTVRPGGGTGTRQMTPIFRHAYPNPFAEETGFRFRLAGPSDVSLTIYAPSGREVRRYRSRSAGAGEHVIVWDGLDGGGRSVAPGVYFARFAFAGTSGSTRVVKIW